MRAIALGWDAPGVLGSAASGTAAVLYLIEGTGKHLKLDSFASLRKVLPGLFGREENRTAEQFAERLPDHWLLERAKGARSATE